MTAQKIDYWEADRRFILIKLWQFQYEAAIITNYLWVKLIHSLVQKHLHAITNEKINLYETIGVQLGLKMIHIKPSIVLFRLVLRMY